MSTRPGDEHVLEVLARTSACTSVDVTLVALFLPKSGAREDFRVQVAAIVHDDHYPPTGLQHLTTPREDTDDPVAIGRKRHLRRPSRGGADLALAQVVETE
jgi:hypothetical protein